MSANTTSSPSSTYSYDSKTGFPFPGRPNCQRQDTDASFFEYYQSPLADRPPHARTLTLESNSPQRQLSADTTDSASQYSSDEQPQADATSSVTNKRPSNPSRGAADRRRLHIVQMNSASEGDSRIPSTVSDTGHDSKLRSRNSLHVRRGVEEKLLGLALIAPPDAKPTSYTNPTPPVVPLSDVQNGYLSHKRSESEVVKRPHYRESTTPSAKAINSLTTNGTVSALVTTPEIGQEKEITSPVAPPVIVRLGSSNTSSSTPSPTAPAKDTSRSIPPPSDYLHYQPGLHARAGPLPPPPEPSSIFALPPSFTQPPPRPPRMRSPSPKRNLNAIKQALQLPPTVTAKLTKSPSSSPEKESPTPVSNNSEELPQPAHRREGAFSPSVFLQHDKHKHSTAPIEPRTEESVDHPTAHVAVVGEPTAADDPDRTIRPPETDSDASEYEDEDDKPLTQQVQRKGSWVDTPPGLSEVPTSPPLPPITPSMIGSTPSPPPKSTRHLPSNMIESRRDGALPRTPSNTISIMTALTDLYPPSSPESSPGSPKMRSNHRRIKALSPMALFPGDVPARKTSLERCVGYADKINELYLYDCGLEDWLGDVKQRGRSQEVVKMPQSPLGQSSFILQRQASKSSLTTEATFPIRPDASAATDLTKAISRDLSSPSALPAVPYPSLIPTQRAHSNRSSASSPASSLRSPILPASKATAFFASLGRKSSSKVGSKKEKSPSGYHSSSSSSGPKVLTKPPKPPNPPKPVVIQAPPVVPGGPRAPPGRQQRSQTLMISSPVQVTDGRASSIARRPSLFTPGPEKLIDLQPDPAFAQQVDKLQDLLPHADRQVLAGYLRRSGHDMLAIGQYLEDEKNGTLKSF